MKHVNFQTAAAQECLKRNYFVDVQNRWMHLYCPRCRVVTAVKVRPASNQLTEEGKSKSETEAVLCNAKTWEELIDQGVTLLDDMTKRHTARVGVFCENPEHRDQELTHVVCSNDDKQELAKLVNELLMNFDTDISHGKEVNVQNNNDNDNINTHQNKKRILIHGAGGGVGAAATQIATSWGAMVFGTCRGSEDAQYVRSLGAFKSVDVLRYPKFQNFVPQVDTVLDATGTASADLWAASRRVLSKGNIVTTNHGISHSEPQTYKSLASVHLALYKQKALSWFLFQQSLKLYASNPNPKDLGAVAELLSRGQFTPHIVQRYPLSQVRQAQHDLESGRIHGGYAVVDMDMDENMDREHRDHDGNGQTK
eukprot:gb/GECH01010910.1/.p1 GENE.gb/GECH01010910.1/~~gb/GECH01010910.1/.p1  ORF type:complete len:367 (+),score=73.19 gb/GECH01010910.1/:1-1101(+)